jgi:hypothetical protein
MFGKSLAKIWKQESIKRRRAIIVVYIVIAILLGVFMLPCCLEVEPELNDMNQQNYQNEDSLDGESGWP